MKIEKNIIEDDFKTLLEDKRHKELLKALKYNKKNNEEIDDNFDRLLEDKRHKEIINVLKEVLISLSKKDNTNVYDFNKIENILKNISLNSNKKDDDLPKSIINLSKIIEDKLNEIKLENHNYNWEFIIHRDLNNLIDKVDAIKVKTKK